MVRRLLVVTPMNNRAHMLMSGDDESFPELNFDYYNHLDHKCRVYFKSTRYTLNSKCDITTNR